MSMTGWYPTSANGLAWMETTQSLLDMLECFPGVFYDRKPAFIEGLFEHGHLDATMELVPHLNRDLTGMGGPGVRRIPCTRGPAAPCR